MNTRTLHGFAVAISMAGPSFHAGWAWTAGRISTANHPAFAAAVLIALLAGCGGGDGNARDNPGGPPQPPATGSDTTPVAVNIGSLTTINSIHLETADPRQEITNGPVRSLA